MPAVLSNRMLDDKPGLASHLTAWLGALYGVMTFQQWIALGGFLLGLGTFAVNAYYKRLDARRKAELAELDRRIREAQLRVMERE